MNAARRRRTFKAKRNHLIRESRYRAIGKQGYRFIYIALTNRLKGTVAGTAMRPIAIE